MMLWTYLKIYYGMKQFDNDLVRFLFVDLSEKSLEIGLNDTKG